MKKTISEYVWWPNINQDVEWRRIHIDYSQAPDKKSSWLVIADVGTKWIEVYPVKSTTAGKTIQCLRDCFARFGVPKQMVSDNGKQFSSKEFDDFCKIQGIKHIQTTPYHSRSNGYAERAIRTMKEKYVKLNHVVDSKERLAICLFWYRNTIQHSTLRSPAESMMGRRLRCLMDNFKPSVAGNVDKATFKQKYFHDRTTQIREFYEGQKIWIKSELKAGYRKGVVVQKT
ncbi:Gag-Pol polyprotein [Thelohanellus kitauei]|uniref:Gag-Pol polyprotein n=1 Tax=Thelohanellus kitauei TaxID=669202 RepID=A0A0C2MDD8_THEKT|nr:Gag-Pol polyprotein [Thelohanellus kitauei]